MILHHAAADFEARKVITQIVSHMLRKHQPTVDYVCGHPEILQQLTAAYQNSEIALTCGSILRECIRHEPLHSNLARSPQMVNQILQAVRRPNFDVATDAFSSFRDLLTLHRSGDNAQWLEQEYSSIFPALSELHKCDNYVTRRLSLKLLAEVLLNRNNFNVMSRYISDASNLKVIMTCLSDPSQAIAFEAFHVFKIFAANPSPASAVAEILHRNKSKLHDFLSTFQRDRLAEDESFREELSMVIERIAQIPKPGC